MRRKRMRELGGKGRREIGNGLLKLELWARVEVETQGEADEKEAGAAL